MMPLPLIADGEDKSSPFANSIRNSYKHVRKWAKRTETNCFRLYDREVPHFPLAIDFYAGRICVHYFAPSREEEEPSEELVNEVARVIKSLLDIEADQIFWRTRARTKITRQYEKIGEDGDHFQVQEFGIKFWVNLTEYLDTGLFLDHRETRHYVSKIAKGKRVLNLFSYTASFSVHAAAAGAAYTKSVDLSNTYTAWAKENFALNNLSLDTNEVVRDDCMQFLQPEIYRNLRYDIIIIDPPTISRSKKMDDLFDIQKDYIVLINLSLKLLNPNGVIFFSTNSRKFSFDENQFSKAIIKEVTSQTLPLDFSDKRIHRCWKITAVPKVQNPPQAPHDGHTKKPRKNVR